MSDTVIVSYFEKNQLGFATVACGSKIYNREDLKKDQWKDLIKLHNLQSDLQHYNCVNLSENQQANALWKKWIHKAFQQPSPSPLMLYKHTHGNIYVINVVIDEI